MTRNVLAFDFGASSGRVLLGSFDGEKITAKEAHRFPNEPIMSDSVLHWDIDTLLSEIHRGIGEAARLSKNNISSMGTDTWGVDFGLIGKDGGRLLYPPVHYRDSRNIGMMERVFEKIPGDYIYSLTGIQFMDINTICQLYYLAQNDPAVFDKTESLLMMPDLFNYLLTGNKITEYSIASTTQLLDARKRDWSAELINKLGIQKDIFTKIARAGEKVGRLKPEIAASLGAEPFDIYTVSEHDTASAVAAVPAKKGESCAYLSCGTWSLLGLELDEPLINGDTYTHNFTNEGGYGGKIRFLKNIIGLWLMQESRRQWGREGKKLSFADIDKFTAKAKPFRGFIDPNSDEFMSPGDMPGRISAYLKRTDQPLPGNIGDISRCITESLALKYREYIETLEKINGKKIDVIHIIGGGVQDRLLCQSTASACGKRVIAGPVEATALGNIAVQLIAAGEFKDIDEARAAIKNSIPLEVYEPQDMEEWREQFEKFKNINAKKE